MDSKQESQSFYLAGLQLAILLKGTPKNLPEGLENGSVLNSYLRKNYHEMAMQIAQKIMYLADEFASTKKSE